MVAFRLLAITPPDGSGAPRHLEHWLKIGTQPSEIAILFRDPGSPIFDLQNAPKNVQDLAQLAREAGVTILESRAVAGPTDFDGVQLRGDPPRSQVESARRHAPIVGRSIHRSPVSAPADYSCFAPVFAPGTDPTGKRGAGLVALAAVCEQCPEPVFALGGITAGRAAACLEAGALGLAGISQFFGHRAGFPEDGRALLTAVRRHGPDPRNTAPR